MPGEFSGKTVLVTGAGSGIGQAHVLHFSALGCRVVAHDISMGALAATLDALDRHGRGEGGVVPFACDVTDAETFEQGVRGLDAAHAVDILINNVGIAGDGAVEEVETSFIDRVFRINIGGTIAATRGVLTGMRQRRAGRIVNTSSNWGVFGHANSSIYAASKAAILGLTKSWALEFAPWRITVNAIAPGGIETALLETSPERLAGIPLGRHGTPEEVARIAAFLASDAAAFMTGTVTHLNGGENIAS